LPGFPGKARRKPDEKRLLKRFFNIVCWVYGQNPEKYSPMVKQGVLPEERAVRCEDEYRQLAKSWSTLLAPYLKE
jgi:Putative metallopeptidase